MEYKQNGKQIPSKRLREHGYTIAPGDLCNTPATGRKGVLRIPYMAGSLLLPMCKTEGNSALYCFIISNIEFSWFSISFSVKSKI